ncbi:Holliday junction branch migration protein RuvA [candidate division KSB1 bacterium]|nr:Holliday junction branch migration protein RuvA [candidate division KSB1 bacterium]
MIASITGKLVHKTPTQVWLENGGLGFEIQISVNTYRQIGVPGTEIKLLTYLYVREDLLQLYGFHSIEERGLFLKLISISGIGPRMAQVILSGMTVSEFINSILNEDINELTRIPGIGKKTAQRLIFDLKDKLAEGSRTAPKIPLPERTQMESQTNDAILALVSLGYPKPNAETTIRKVQQKYGAHLAVEEQIRLALREIQ